MSFSKDIRKARPDLRDASPLTFWICVGYIVLNIVLAFYVYTQPDVSNLALYFGPFTPQFWGIAFGIQAVTLTGGLVANSWSGTRSFLGVGLFIKAFYAYSLVELGLRSGFKGIASVLAIWLFITWVQFWTIVFFAAPVSLHPVKGPRKLIDDGRS